MLFNPTFEHTLHFSHIVAISFIDEGNRILKWKAMTFVSIFEAFHPKSKFQYV
jgi:hypothetical protein